MAADLGRTAADSSAEPPRGDPSPFGASEDWAVAPFVGVGPPAMPWPARMGMAELIMPISVFTEGSLGS
jgi:hypothetical protein